MKKRYLWLSIIASVLLIVSSITSPLFASAKSKDMDAANLTEEQLELSTIIQEHLSFDVKKGEVVIHDKNGLKKALKSSLNKSEYKVTYNEINDTIKKMNKVINSEEGKEIKAQIISELSKQANNAVYIAGLSGCGYATLAGFAHTAAFSGLMTIAGISGPAGWIIGTAVGGTWLVAQAAAGCLG
ncbi:hypothetical protein UACE39S_01429 [Ureibacillus acetophenoni]